MSPVFTKDIRRVSSADNVVKPGDTSSLRWDFLRKRKSRNFLSSYRK